MSDSRGDDAPIHPYPGTDRPAGPGAEDGGVRGQPADDPEAPLPSELQGHADE